MKRVVIVGGGFAGLNCAKALAKRSDVEVCLLDRRNYHLFQPLLYQVAMAGLSPADIASPIRGLFSKKENVQVFQAEVQSVDRESQVVSTTVGIFKYDYLVLAAGGQHAYFGNEHWEQYAPGLKNLEQATEIRRRVLGAFEKAECEPDAAKRRALLTFAVVGGGPTGVELAGALGEMTRYTLARDFRHINPKRTRIVLIEAGGGVLKSFHSANSEKVTEELERLGVQIWTNCRVTNVNEDGVFIGSEHLATKTVIWAAGVQASPVGKTLNSELDRSGRVVVKADLSLPGYPEVLVVGDQSHFRAPHMAMPLPAVASVAIQQGHHAAGVIAADILGRNRTAFRYRDKGQMATIGRRKAVLQRGGFRTVGTFAWLAWLFVHIYFLSGFRNRVFVLLHWGWSYLTFARGSRLIVEKEWLSYGVPASAKPKPDAVEVPGKVSLEPLAATSDAVLDQIRAEQRAKTGLTEKAVDVDVDFDVDVEEAPTRLLPPPPIPAFEPGAQSPTRLPPSSFPPARELPPGVWPAQGSEWDEPTRTIVSPWAKP